MANKRSIMIKDLPSDLSFISDSQDVEIIQKSYRKAKEFDSFFCKIDGGDFTEIWGIYGIVAFLNKTAYRIL